MNAWKKRLAIVLLALSSFGWAGAVQANDRDGINDAGWKVRGAYGVRVGNGHRHHRHHHHR